MSPAPALASPARWPFPAEPHRPCCPLRPARLSAAAVGRASQDRTPHVSSRAPPALAPAALRPASAAGGAAGENVSGLRPPGSARPPLGRPSAEGPTAAPARLSSGVRLVAAGTPGAPGARAAGGGRSPTWTPRQVRGRRPRSGPALRGCAWAFGVRVGETGG